MGRKRKSDSSHYWHEDRADSLQHNPECLEKKKQDHEECADRADSLQQNPECLKSELDHEKFADRAITIVFM
jgi:hypothetical protein